MQFAKQIDHVEEIELCKKAQQGGDDGERAKSVVVNANLGLVAHIAKKNYYKNDQYSFDDLFQEGVFGLVRAIEKFDPTEGCRFSTYSYYWIYAFISRFKNNNRGSIRLPLHVTDKMRTLEKKDKVAFEEYKSKIPVAVSLNKMISDSTSILDLVSDEDDTNILDRIDTEILMEQIKELLSEKEFDVLCNRYGLEGREQKTHRECAKIYGVSHTAVYLIEKKAFEKIRKTFATK
jgi:RNA polymerase sigma factor (sigma-70 family)|tara:strand:+ start:4294 stop:4995 length:702 start_codon:yes stop_codon:yes gene_type:complete